MKNKSTLQQRLKSYSALAGAVAATAGAATEANAQIVYTDVTPDTTVNATNTAYNLDLNNDGTVDFIFGFYAGVYNYGSQSFPYNLTYVYTQSTATNKVDTMATEFPAVHNLNDSIKATNKWSDAGAWLLGYAFTTLPYSGGDWLGATDKYLGVQFAIGTNIHHGWVRLDHASNASSITIKDYAYNTVPLAPIKAGETSVTVGIPAIELNAKVYAHNKVVNVKLGEVKDATISIVDVTGREVTALALGAGSTQIDLSAEASGVYFVNVKTAEGNKVTKVSIQ